MKTEFIVMVDAKGSRGEWGSHLDVAIVEVQAGSRPCAIDLSSRQIRRIVELHEGLFYGDSSACPAQRTTVECEKKALKLNRG